MNDKTLVLGIGNTILSDDAAGILVARGIGEELAKARPDAPVECVEASCAGWRLMDLIAGYRRVVIIDSMKTGQGLPGECFRIDIDNITSSHLQSSHGLGLCEALSLLDTLSRERPGGIALYAVEVANPWEFGETLTPQVAQAIPGIVRQIMAEEGLLP